VLLELKIVIEYDGCWYESGWQWVLDNERIVRLWVVGWIVIIVIVELFWEFCAFVVMVVVVVVECRVDVVV